MTIMRGLPASGKSTKAAEIIREGNTVRINKDLLRTMLHLDKFTGRNDGHTRDAARKLADWFLANSVNVVIDDTNLNPATVQSWKDLAKIHGAKIEYADCLDVSVEECIARDAAREKRVGAHVIQRMALQHLSYLAGERAIICDLDGTLCDIRHRLGFVQGETKNWHALFGAISNDILRMDVVEQIAKWSTADTRLILVSARPDTYREATEQWLEQNFHLRYAALIMRDSNDKRPDTEVKADFYDKYLKRLDIAVIFDDRPSVIRMWRERGLNVIDVGQGVEF